MTDVWKENWPDSRRRLTDWWNGKGVVAAAWAPIQGHEAREQVPDPGPPDSLEQKWTDIEWRIASLRHRAARMRCPLETVPYFPPDLGPGTLALYLGSEARLQPNTIWYEPCIEDPDSYGNITFSPDNAWWQFQVELIDRMMAAADGHYFVGSPDLIENWDTLASLRGAETLMMDMMERPAWVEAKISEINRAWFQVYERLYTKLRSQDGTSMFAHFGLWAPGRVAKVQCDGCAMFSPDMFRRFVQPALSEQCDRLDYSLYHLDGSQCLDKLDALLEIDNLTAIEWTPDPKVPSGGSLHWAKMYRRILDAGKRVQILNAEPDEIEPVLDAIGTDGVFFLNGNMSRENADRYEAVFERVRG